MNTDSINVALVRISTDDASTLRNLFELYAYDFSELVPLHLHPNGRFDVPVSDDWWTRDDHFPFFIRSSDELLGFALARRGSRLTDDREVMDVAEFFVVRGARRKGVGIAAVRALLAALPGPWEVRVRRTNPLAKAFWSRALASASQPVSWRSVSHGGVDWDVARVGSEVADG